jgi:hypothetical protein
MLSVVYAVSQLSCYAECVIWLSIMAPYLVRGGTIFIIQHHTFSEFSFFTEGTSEKAIMLFSYYKVSLIHIIVNVLDAVFY